MSASGAEEPRKPAAWPLALPPLVIFGGVFVAIWLGGFISDLYLDTLLPFLFSFWIGMGFAFAWDTLRYSMYRERFPPIMMAITGLLCALVILSMLGFETLWQDPWIVGVAVVPGFTLARPWIQRRLTSISPGARDHEAAPPAAPES